MRFDWLITNVGKTTARIMEVNIRCRKYTLSDPLPDTPQFREAIAFPGVPLAPNDSLKGWTYMEAQERDYNGLTPQDVANIRSMVDELVAYGLVRYLDSFGNGHVSRFCYYYATFCEEFRINLRAPAAYHECD